MSKNLKNNSEKLEFLVGIDEVGRGCLAGPLTVAALALPKNFKKWPKLPLRDSKKLSEKQRKEWLEWIEEEQLLFSIVSIAPAVIDEINVSQAANLAATKATRKLLNDFNDSDFQFEIFLDGGLFVNKSLNSKFNIVNTNTIIKGDEKIPVISLASIVAKIHRDKLMKKMHKKYPEYGFLNNVGYGTAEHIAAIRKIGQSEIHRKSFKIDRE